MYNNGLPIFAGLHIPIHFLKGSGQLDSDVLCSRGTVVHDTEDRSRAQYQVGRRGSGVLSCCVGTVEMEGCIHLDRCLVAPVVGQCSRKRNGLQLNADVAKHVAGAHTFVGEFWYL